jgi:hypothetical protein
MSPRRLTPDIRRRSSGQIEALALSGLGPESF